MLQQIKSYLKYQVKASNANNIDSAFIENLYQQVISPQKEYYVFAELEALRQQLLSDQREINITDFGAGSRIMKGNTRKIADIAKHSVGGEQESRLLFRLIEHFKPTVMLELGTSLGLNTLYQQLAYPAGEMVTFEGCPHIAAIAKENFARLNVSPTVEVGNLDETLPSALQRLDRLDYVFFDANHRYEPTISYFEQCLPKSHHHSIFIFDDIHWSAEMEQAWEEIQQHEQVSITVDLYDLGLVFFHETTTKQHYTLRF